MQDTLSFGDLFKILLKKIKTILIITVVLTVGAAVLLSMTNLYKKPETYQVRLYGVIQYQYADSGSQLHYVTNTVNEIYKSDVILLALENMDYSNCSDAFLDYYGATRESINSVKAKKELAAKIFKDYRVTFNATTQLFQISIIGQDPVSQEYVLQHIFNEGSMLSKAYIPNADIQLFNKETIAKKEEAPLFTYGAKLIFVIGFLIFFFVWLGMVLKIVFSDTVVSVEQFKRRYPFPVLGTTKKKEDGYEEIAQVILYRLKRNKTKYIYFLSTSPKWDGMGLVLKIKEIIEKNQVPIALMASKDNTEPKYNGMFSDAENLATPAQDESKIERDDITFVYMDQFSKNSAAYGLLEEEKDVILLVECRKIKYAEIESILEKIDLYEGKVDGVILID